MFSKIQNIIVRYIMILLYLMLVLALWVGQVNIITSLLVCGICFMSGYISFTRGVECSIDDEMEGWKEMYRERVIEEYNKIQNEIRNN